MTKKIEEQVSLKDINSDVSITRTRPDRNEMKRLLRNPLTLSSVLGVDLDHNNYTYRFVVSNDPGRVGQVEYYQRLGYEIVHDTKKVGDSRSENAAITGSAVRASGGGGIELILMRVPNEIHKEIVALREEITNENSLGIVSQQQSSVGRETKIRGTTIN